MENFTKTMVDFREVDMKMKLKECQRVKMIVYHHQRPYKKGYKVWHQNKNGKCWCGLELVHCQKGRSL